MKPTGRTALNALKDAGLDVIGVGKINDIFCGEGITQTYHSDSSVHGMQQTIEICKEDFHGLCFVNLVDFDALWGHRRNPEGYGREIEKFDRGLGTLMNELREDDLLILTADPQFISGSPCLIHSPANYQQFHQQCEPCSKHYLVSLILHIPAAR